MEKKVYFYELGYAGWDEGGDISLISDKLYTREEFTDLVATLYAKAYRLYRLEDPESFEEYEHVHRHMDWSYLDRVVNMLLKDYGFQKLEYDATWHVSSNYNIDQTPIENGYGDEVPEIIALIKKKIDEA